MRQVSPSDHHASSRLLVGRGPADPRWCNGKSREPLIWAIDWRPFASINCLMRRSFLRCKRKPGSEAYISCRKSLKNGRAGLKNDRADQEEITGSRPVELRRAGSFASRNRKRVGEHFRRRRCGCGSAARPADEVRKSLARTRLRVGPSGLKLRPRPMGGSRRAREILHKCPDSLGPRCPSTVRPPHKSYSLATGRAARQPR